MPDERLAVQATIKRAAIAAQRAMDQLDSEVLSDLERLYKQAAAELKQRIASYGAGNGNIALSQLQDVLRQVNARLNNLNEARDRLLQLGMKQAADLGVLPLTASGIGAAGMPIIDSYAAMQLSDEALRFVRTFVAADGLHLSDRIWRLDRQARDLLTNAIELAVVQGYGAGQAAAELLSRGQQVPIDIQSKLGAANAAKIAQEATMQLLSGTGSPMDNAMRVMRTELNRAHGEAYMAAGEKHPDFAGWKFLLSPAHPAPDICDLHSTANLHGLGPGVYPSRAKCPWPAHPNTISYVEIVFADEVTDADRAGKETPLQALDRLSQAQQRGVLGAHKHEAFKEGRLSQGMIKAPWREVRARIGDKDPVPRPKAKPKELQGIDGMLVKGREVSSKLIEAARAADGSVDGTKLLADLHAKLKTERAVMTPAKIENGGRGAQLVRMASQMFPDDWTKATDRFGPLHAKLSSARGAQVSLPKTAAGKYYRGIFGFSGVAKGGDGFIRTDNFSTALHEYTHRLQHALPELDDFFQELHGRRTKGDQLKLLRDLYPYHGYAKSEKAREDKYRVPYQGKEYTGTYYLGRHGALEVMTMAFEDVLGGNSSRLVDLIEKDREMLDLVVGLLFNYVP
jgi:hypothetical protein